MADITLNITVKDAIVPDVVNSLCDTYGGPATDEQGNPTQTKNQRAKEIVRNFIRNCYVNWKTSTAAKDELSIAKANADSDINN